MAWQRLRIRVRAEIADAIGDALLEAGALSVDASDAAFGTPDEHPIFGEPVTGWRLEDGRASWGFGLQLFFLGYPMHFDWVKYTDFATTSRGWDFTFWIGYDF